MRTHHRLRQALAVTIAAATVATLVGLTTPASARPASPASPDGVIVLPVNGDVTTTIVSRDAGDQLAYGLASPRHRQVCDSCSPGQTLDLGHFGVGAHLTFYLIDETHQATYLSTDVKHAKIVRISPIAWEIHWDDAGGDGDYNDLVTSVVLTHTR